MPISLPVGTLTEVKESFLAELVRSAGVLDAAIERIALDPADKAGIEQLRRVFHVIAGCAAYAGFDALGHLAATCDDTCSMLLDGTLPASPRAVAILRHGVAGVESTLVSSDTVIQNGGDHRTPSRPPPSASALEGAKILVIDDDPISAKVAGHCLEAAGFVTMYCTNPAQSIEAMEKEEPDLILLDVMMPGVDGFELCRHVREHRALAFTPIVFLTRISEIDQKVRGLEAGGDDYISKPFEPRELIARLRTHLTRQHALRDMSKRIGKYEIVRPLGVGGMGATFLACFAGPEGFRKMVVIKKLLPHLAQNPESLGLFLREARLAATITHPNVVQIFQLGSDEGQYFIAMEYVDGPNLGTLLSVAAHRKELPPVEIACRVISDVCGALHAAHNATGDDGAALSVVHRDVSSRNVLVSSQGVVKLTDFGIAKVVGQVGATHTGEVRGTTAYLSPEQIRGERVDARSDVFSAGVLLYEHLTLRRPFRRSSDYTTYQAILHESVRPLSSFRDDVPPELEHLCSRMLEKSAESRVQNAQEAQNMLEAILGRLGRPSNAAVVAAWARALSGPATTVDVSANESWLPLGPTKTVPCQPWPAPERDVEVNKQLRVLLIDDSTTMRAVLKLLVGSGAYEFIEAERGDDGLRLAQTYAFDLVIADLHMPGMDGLEFVHAVRNDAREPVRALPIIVVTAEVDEQIRKRVTAAGASALLLKPVTTNQLKEAIDGVMPRGPSPK